MEGDTQKLPEDLVFAEILSKLPAKSLMRFKCVSKSWLSRISSDSSFIAAHLTHHSNADSELSILFVTYKSLDLEGQDITRQRVSQFADPTSSASEIVTSSYMKPSQIFSLIGSCNGLVCVKTLRPDESKPRIALWNPATREYRYVAETPPEEPSMSFFGFGFDDQSNDYKIVKLLSSGPSKLARTEVFAKSSGQWRAGSGGVSGLIVISSNGAVSAGGALHWLAYRETEGGEINSGGIISREILSFRLSDEALRVLDPPGGVGSKVVELFKWRESLAALVWGPTRGSWLWTASASSDGKDELIWSRMVRVSPAVTVAWLVGVWKEEFMMGSRSRRGLGLSLREAALDGKARKLKRFRPNVIWIGAHYYVESLVSVFS